MGILAEDAARKLVGVGLSHHVGAGIHKPLHHRRGARGRGMQPQPIRIARAGDVSFDVEQILGGKGAAGQRSRRRAP
jgi:hypothetical protein